MGNFTIKVAGWGWGLGNCIFQQLSVHRLFFKKRGRLKMVCHLSDCVGHECPIYSLFNFSF